MDDAEEFAATREGFHTLGFSAEQMMEVFELVVAILNMGNVEFEDEYKVSVGDIAQLDGPESKQALDEAARLLRMAPETLEGALKNATKKIVGGRARCNRRRFNLQHAICFNTADVIVMCPHFVTLELYS